MRRLHRPLSPSATATLLHRRFLCSSASSSSENIPIDVAYPTIVAPSFPNASPIKTREQRRQLMKEATDLRLPHEMFPHARTMRRTIHAHLGPTNSGKTHHALEALRAADSGVYCGPLRLLAWEVHDRLSNDGVACTLRTGQETIEAENSFHTSCTIEMCALHSPVSVAVLDEIQMLSHPERGWAWSRALLGLPASEVHVCGSADSLPLLRELVDFCGDSLVEYSYERLTPLRTASHSLYGDLSQVRPGDCVVAFSRKDIFQLKASVEAASGLQCGVVYGSLPPETRKQQARLFNAPDTAEEVLVASDAVGMGLNLNINRIIFASMTKFDGKSVRSLEPTEVKQIAGRAGRYKSRFEHGEVTVLHEQDLPALRRALNAPLQPLAMAGLAPTFEQLSSFDRASKGALPFSELLRAFEEAARVGRRYFCVSMDSMVRNAEVLDRVDAWNAEKAEKAGSSQHEDNLLGLLERHTFCMAPLDARDSLHATLLTKWATDLSRGKPVRIRYAPPTRKPSTHEEMQQLESYFKALDGYLWLAQRFPLAFSHGERVAEYREAAAALIDVALEDPPNFDRSVARKLGLTNKPAAAGGAKTAKSIAKQQQKYDSKRDAKRAVKRAERRREKAALRAWSP